MAQSFSKRLLSGSTNGRNVKIVATTTPGTTVHTAVTGTTDFDEIYGYAVNTSASTVTLTVEFGGTTSPDDLIIVQLLAYQGLYLVVPGLLLQNSLVVKAFASVANVVEFSGFVNRITA